MTSPRRTLLALTYWVSEVPEVGARMARTEPSQRAKLTRPLWFDENEPKSRLSGARNPSKAGRHPAVIQAHARLVYVGPAWNPSPSVSPNMSVLLVPSSTNR